MSRGLARLEIANITGSVIYTVTELDFPTAEKTPGEVIAFRVTREQTGTTPPPVGTVLLTWKDPSRVAFTTTWNVTTFPQDSSYGFTVDPNGVGGASRAGTLELVLRATNTNPSGYDVSTDNQGTQTLTAGQTAIRDRHWQRANTTLELKSGIGSSVTGTPVLSYGDSQNLRVTVGVPLYGQSTVIGRLRRVDTNAELANTTFVFPSGGISDAITSDIGIVDNTYPAARLATTMTVDAFAAVGVSGQAAMVPTSVTVVQSPDLDPRLTVVRHMQHDDKNFGTPPGSKDAGIQRLTTKMSFLASRLINARSEGINGITLSRHLYDQSELAGTPTAGVVSRTDTTATVGGEAGWTPVFLVWQASGNLPTGTWFVRHDATGTDAGGMLTPADTAHVLAASNPDLRMLCSGNPASTDNHFIPGGTYEALAGVIDINRAKRIEVDVDSMKIALVRRNKELERTEYLDADEVTWIPITLVSVVHFFSTTSLTNDPYSFKRLFANTGSWTTDDVLVVGRATVGGVPVHGYDKEHSLGSANSHAGHAFDPTGLFK